MVQIALRPCRYRNAAALPLPKRRGLAATETPRSIAFCHHTIAAADGLAVEDALLDPRVAQTPLVQGEPHIRSYLGAPLRTPDG